jgi:hypothetical protein
MPISMNAKIVITLILGLVFQLAQVLPGAAVSASCTPQAESCDCCAGLDSCPCAETGEPNQKPAPLVPDTGGVLKLPAVRSTGTHVSADPVREVLTSATAAVLPPTESPAGYAGIRLSVAFCTFVI